MDYQKILINIRRKAKEIKRPLRFMELCGTHTQTVAENALKSILPKNIQLVSGPGCPVCVIDQTEVDLIAGLALSNVPIAAYGDAINVPGNLGSLEEARQKGAKVYAIYDVAQALVIQKKEPRLVFWGLGFETTTPATAWGIQQGLTVFSSHKIFPPAMEALLKNKKIKIDGFFDPGHVSAIIGTEVYQQFKIPQVVAGFEAIDVLLAIDMLLSQIIKKEILVENEYTRLVKKEGNKKALALIKDTFRITDSPWRGLGIIKKSGLKLRKKYQKQDAEFIYQKQIKAIKKRIKIKPSACRCGEVLQGLIEPIECPLFGKICTPDNPQGACMVSVEGGCNVEYRYSQ